MQFPLEHPIRVGERMVLTLEIGRFTAVKMVELADCFSVITKFIEAGASPADFSATVFKAMIDLVAASAGVGVDVAGKLDVADLFSIVFKGIMHALIETGNNAPDRADSYAAGASRIH